MVYKFTKKIIIFFFFLGCTSFDIKKNELSTIVNISVGDGSNFENYSLKTIKLDKNNYINSYDGVDSAAHDYHYIIMLERPNSYIVDSAIYNSDEKVLRKIGKKEYLVGQNVYSVYSFMAFENIIDGAVRLFWCREFGVFHYYCPPWNSHTVVKFNNNKIVDQLRDQLLGDSTFFFYANRLPPKPG